MGNQLINYHIHNTYPFRSFQTCKHQTCKACFPLHLRYLQEVGYTDTILDVKSQRVRALLGLAGDPGDRSLDQKTEPMVNGTEPSSLKDSDMVR